MNHKVTINITDADGRWIAVMKGAEEKLSIRLLRFLFGDFTQVYHLSPGQAVQFVDISEVREGGKK